MKQPTIGIVGYGMVGGAVGAWFKQAKIFDQSKYPDGLAAVNRCEIVFICVPTPYKKSTGYDYRAIELTAKRLTGRKIVVLKSTVLPGKTAELQKKFPQHTWLFNPEFLQDKTARQDFIQPNRQIVGWAKQTKAHRRAARQVMSILPAAPHNLSMTSTEAELVKLFSNSFFAFKVVYANMMYDTAQQAGANYEQVRLGVGNDPRIGRQLMNIWQDGFRGYGGKCLPKDIQALLWLAEHHRQKLPLLKIIQNMNSQYNKQRRKKRNITV